MWEVPTSNVEMRHCLYLQPRKKVIKLPSWTQNTNEGSRVFMEWCWYMWPVVACFCKICFSFNILSVSTLLSLWHTIYVHPVFNIVVILWVLSWLWLTLMLVNSQKYCHASDPHRPKCFSIEKVSVSEFYGQRLYSKNVYYFPCYPNVKLAKLSP
jgi:hypothetical protein